MKKILLAVAIVFTISCSETKNDCNFSTLEVTVEKENKEAQKERANQQRNAPRQPSRSAPANRSGKAQGPPRNPLTGSSVDRGGGARAKAKPAQ